MSEQNRLFRVAVLDPTGKLLTTENPTKFYTEAHMSSADYDSDYPHKQACVQQSLDGGATWAEYDANERIAGKPAWAHHLHIWQAKTGVR